MECHKVERVTAAGENGEDGKVELPVEVTEECLMLPTKPTRDANPSALNFGGYFDIKQFSDDYRHPLGRVKLVPGCRLEGQNLLPNKFASVLEKSLRLRKGDIVASTNEPE
ncbi:hypothetical protein N9L68_04860 [bacterium]|nr:hypothetical protein [bacterium]